VHFIDLSEVISACTFGDADMKTLFLTARGLVHRARPDNK
jgi:sugar lactone lactonase YvrE